MYADAGSGDVSVGACSRDITPISPLLAPAYEERFGEARPVNHSDPVYMAGFGTDRQATDYNDRLWARGVVIGRRLLNSMVGKQTSQLGERYYFVWSYLTSRGYTMLVVRRSLKYW